MEGDIKRINGGLCNSWFSHVPKSRIPEFLGGFHGKLAAGSVVFMADNVFVPWVGGELVTKDGGENTFKMRVLSEGSQFEVVKNYYTQGELRRLFEPWSKELKIHIGKCFWWVKYKIDYSE